MSCVSMPRPRVHVHAPCSPPPHLYLFICLLIRLLNLLRGRKRDETYLHLVMDFLPETIRSTSMQYQKERQRFPIDHIRVYLYQTLKALE